MTDEPLSPGDLLPPALERALPPAAAGARRRVLYFMRTADCAVCRGHVRRLAALAPELRALGADVVVIAPAAAAAAPSIAGQPFPVLLVDGLHAAAGLSRALFGKVQQSGTVLVDGAGVVRLVRRATIPFQAFDERELLAALRGEASWGDLAAHASS